jgi:hypothetical protein
MLCSSNPEVKCLGYDIFWYGDLASKILTTYCLKDKLHLQKVLPNKINSTIQQFTSFMFFFVNYILNFPFIVYIESLYSGPVGGSQY